MKICKTKLIPCPAVLTEWSELPCMWSQEQCDTWCKKVQVLKFQDKNGNTFEADLSDIAEKAKKFFDLGYKEVKLADIFPDK